MKHTRILLLIALLGAAAIGLPSLAGATITVVNTNDNGPGSLRQAIADAVDGDTVDFNSSLNGQTITLTSGQLMVDKSVAIRGPGANRLTVNANNASRVFYIASGKDVTIFGLTITNGSAPGNFGGGIYNDHASLMVSSCTISGNSADQGTGGGIYNDGYGGTGSATMTITSSTISGNSAWPGGGICNDGTAASAMMTITNSTISGNSDNGWNYGGGVLNFGMLTITNSTLSGNSAYSGGAIYNWQGAMLTITNNTFSGNFCSSGFNGHGGGILNEGGTLKIGNTIFKAGPSGENIYNVPQLGPVTSLGYNLSSDDGGGCLTATGDRINTDPMLGPLQNNGGPTFTHLPASNSPAIDAGDPALGMDQRGAGFQRVANGRIDIGATEVQATSAPTPTPSPTPAPVHVTVQTNPAGLAFSVDGTTYSSAQTFGWVPGSSHTIATTSPQNGATGIRYVWTNWTGGGAISHTVAPTTNKVYTANFNTQYFLTMNHNTGGSVSPGSGWKASGVTISISATPSSAYHFTNWTGSGTGSFSGTTNPVSITIGGPTTETATFTHN